MQVVNNRDGTWTVHYTANEVGETFLDIFLGDDLVSGSPFKVNIFDVNRIQVANLKEGLVGHPVEFSIDVSDAGIGQLEIIIQEGRIPCTAWPIGTVQFDASFMPHESGRHLIDIKFNGLPVPGTRLRNQLSTRDKTIDSFF
jgi:filamin